jgi:hypothetical protein
MKLKNAKNISLIRTMFENPRASERVILQRLFHKSLYPMISEFTINGKLAFTPQQTISQLTDLQFDSTVYSNILQEYLLLTTELKVRYEGRKLLYPTTYGVETGTALLIYYFIRTLKPKVIVETGVANGDSTYYILKALDKNNSGVLHSFDVSTNVGVLINNDERNRWFFHIVKGNKRESFTSQMRQIGEIDFFIHDSKHEYPWQFMEYQTAFAQLSGHGFLCSDDIDTCYAFLDFSRIHQTSPLFLIDYRKIFGIIRKE